MTAVSSSPKLLKPSRGVVKERRKRGFFSNSMHTVTLAALLVLVGIIVACVMLAKPSPTLNQSFESSFPIINYAGIGGLALVLFASLSLSLFITFKLTHQGVSYLVLTILLVPTFWVLSSAHYFQAVDLAPVSTWAQGKYGVEISDKETKANPDSIVDMKTGEVLFSEKQYSDSGHLEWILKSYTTGAELKRNK